MTKFSSKLLKSNLSQILEEYDQPGFIRYVLDNNTGAWPPEVNNLNQEQRLLYVKLAKRCAKSITDQYPKVSRSKIRWWEIPPPRLISPQFFHDIFSMSTPIEVLRHYSPGYLWNFLVN